MSKACPRCGATNPEAALFCASCGSNLTGPQEERRFVTVLFADLTGFTEFSEHLDPEAVKATVDPTFRRLADLVAVYGGRVDKIIGDEIMAVFGAPQAHEDDPERAVRCALEMQREMRTLAEDRANRRGASLSLRIGINSGEVMAGTVAGSDAYTVLGDVVNTANRIVKAAEPGQVLAGESTRKETEHAIRYRDREHVTVKGKQAPVTVWEAVGEAQPPGGRPARAATPFTGREEELALLEAFAAIVRRDRHPVALTIIGEAGVGKTRLVEEFADRARTSGARVLAGRSLPYGTTSPSFAVEEMVRAAFEVDPSASPEAASARVIEGAATLGLVGETDRLRALLGLRDRESSSLRAGRPGPAGDLRASGGGEPLQAGLTVLRAVAEREHLLVLVFQEGHWAEDALLAGIDQMLGGARSLPLLLVCLARPELLDRQPAWIRRPSSAVLTLEPLARERAARILDALLASRSIHPALHGSILERAGGNPLYLEEFARLMLARDDPGVEGPSVAVPGSISALVVARLDGLPPGARRVAQLASVVGERFWLGAVAGLLPGEDIEKPLAILVEQGLVEPATVSPLPDEHEARFRQTIVRDVAYASLPKTLRAQTHNAVAAWLEERARAHALDRTFSDLVAHHYERAATLAREIGAEVEGAAAKARESLERSGNLALELDASTAAADFYQRALAFAADERDRLTLRLALAEALVGGWHLAGAEQHLADALQEAKRLGERAIEGKAYRLLGDALRIRGELDRARVYTEQGLEIAKEVRDIREEAEALRSHGLADLFQGRLSSAALWFRQALARARDAGDRRMEAWSLQNLAWANMLLGRLDEALENTREGAGIFGEAGDGEGLAWCEGLRTYIMLFQGKLLEADRVQRQIENVIPAAMRDAGTSTSVGWAMGQVLRAIVALARCRVGEADAFAREAFEVFESAEIAWPRGMVRFPLAEVALARRQFARAREHAADGLAAIRAGDPVVTSILLFVDACAALGQGRLDEADRLHERIWELTERAGVPWIRDIASRWLAARILLARGRPGEARRLLDEAVRLPKAGVFSRAHVIALLAEVLVDLGDAGAAEGTARRAIGDAGDDLAARSEGLRALARALLAAGREEDALAAGQEAVAALADTDHDEERIRSLASVATAAGALGRDEEARDALARAQSLLGRFPEGADLGALKALLSETEGRLSSAAGSPSAPDDP